MTQAAFDLYTELPPQLYHYPAEREVRITDAVSADAVRRRAVAYLWPAGTLPATLPAVDAVSRAIPELAELDGVPLGRVERLDVQVDFGYHHVTYLVHPPRAAAPARLLILHQGHQDGLQGGFVELAAWALAEGFLVALMQMPYYGWNQQRTFTLPEGAVTLAGDHNELMETLEGRGGSALRFFLEPVVAVTNCFAAQHPDARDISMIGLSGGGWTTHLAAALDPRIRLSVPAAGAYPLYLRDLYPGSRGDLEQFIPALYEERASWLDLFILGGAGAGRRQIQLLNQFDSCCFYGIAYTTYADVVARAAAALGGRWAAVLDASHRAHLISPWALETVIVPALTAETP